MDQDTRTKVTEELTKYLNRAPTENEILNAQTDQIIMGRVRDKKFEDQKKAVEDLQEVIVDNNLTKKVIN